MQKNLVDILKSSINNCKKPTDLKPSIIGKVVQLSPVIVSISEPSIKKDTQSFLTESLTVFGMTLPSKTIKYCFARGGGFLFYIV